MKRQLWYLIFTLALLSGCATIRTNPTDADQAQVNAAVQNATASIVTGLGIADEAGKFLNTLPISASAKNSYDCAIVRVTGTSTPRPQLLTVCGPSTPQGPGPLHAALETLKRVTSKASLNATLTEVKGRIEPLIVQLEGSDQPALRAFGLSLRIAFALVLNGGLS